MPGVSHNHQVNDDHFDGKRFPSDFPGRRFCDILFPKTGENLETLQKKGYGGVFGERLGRVIGPLIIGPLIGPLPGLNRPKPASHPLVRQQ